MNAVQRGSRAAFGYASFRRYVMARFLANSSSEMQSVAVGWQVYQITHRPLDLGLVGLAQFLPGFCLFLLAGHVADRFPRNRILQLCYCAFAICSALLIALAADGVKTPWPIYIVLLLNGTVRAFHAPASQAILPLLVDEADFSNAVAWASSLFQVAMVAGPLVGGLVYGIAASPVPVFGLSALFYLAAFVLFRRVHLKPSERKPEPPSVSVILGGLRYIFENRLILGAISLDLFAVLLGGAVALMPVFAEQILHIGAFGLGVLRGAPAAGAVLTAIAVAHWPLKRRAGWAMLGCVFVFGIFTVLFGLSQNLWISLVALFLIGASDMVSVIVRHTMVQLATPDAMRGRVSAVNTVFIGASNEVGQFESGLTAHWFGTVPAVVIGGVGTMLVVAAWAAFFPSLRRVDELAAESLVRP